MPASLPSLLAQLPSLFPASSPLALRPSADAFAPSAPRFSGGHAARWFAASDGQEGERPFALAHALCSLAEALDALSIADEIRSDFDGYWVEAHWLAIASDGAGQHLMIDDRDGRVLAVAHDDDHIEVLAPSVEAWLEHLLEGHGNGAVVWDPHLGLIDQVELDRLDAMQIAQAARQRAAPLPVKHKLGLALTVGLALGLMGLWIWFLETYR